MERKILEISGSERLHFLQGLVTNDVMRTRDGPVYAALLTPQGKFIVDFFLIAHGDNILVDVAAPFAAALAQRLNMYRLRADVVIGESPLTVSRGTGKAPDGAVTDPRHKALGWRLYSDASLADDTDWDAIRVAHTIPETGIELTPDTYILEAGFERLNGVDFRKGCYVGQEITARMKHKTELKKGLVSLDITGSAPVGSPVTTGAGKPAGTLFTQSGGRALAHLRFDRATGPMRAGDATLTWTP
ncbi:MAG TPA: folate-binding protein [Aliiroseovarius sp.]|nr:folate-binding protein [Aliiroseovarius sp.]